MNLYNLLDFLKKGENLTAFLTDYTEANIVTSEVS